MAAEAAEGVALAVEAAAEGAGEPRVVLLLLARSPVGSKLRARVPRRRFSYLLQSEMTLVTIYEYGSVSPRGWDCSTATAAVATISAVVTATVLLWFLLVVL